MKFSVSLNDLQRAVQRVLPAIPPKSTLPVLEHIHCTVSSGTLTMIATDQEMTISTSLSCFAESDGAVLIPARRLNELVKSLGQEGSVEISVSPRYDLTLLTNAGKFNMKGMDTADFPQQPVFPEGTKATVQAADIMKIANKTLFAVSTDEYRPAMTGVLFQFRGTEVRGVATDSYRLARVTVQGQDFPEDLDVIIPARAMEILRKVESDVEMSVTRTHARFVLSSATIITRIIDERFPPYENVIPADNDKIALVNQKDLLSIIRRVSLFTSTTNRQVRLTLMPDKLNVHGEDEDSGSNADESAACDFNGGAQFEIGFNHKYLEEALQHVPGDDNGMIKMSFSSPNRASLIESTADAGDLLILIMPVRL